MKFVERFNEILKISGKRQTEVAAAVNKNGLYLSGGVAKLPYAAEYLSKKLEMRVRTCAEPQYAVITGAGALLRDKKLFKNICLSE